MSTPNATFGEADLPGGAHPDPVLHAPRVVAGGWNVRWTASTGSTNDDLWRAGRAGAPDRLVLVADHQEAGKGRLDRRWEAPAGANLLVSILFRTVDRNPHDLVHAVAVAAATAVRTLTSHAARLKWPNDVLVDDRKLAGILATAGPHDETSGRSAFVVVGMGLNVGWAPDGAARLGDGVSVGDVLAEFLTELDAVSRLGVDELHARYRSLLATIGREVRVELPDGSTVEGRAIDVELDGRLAVLDACGVTHRYHVGDIVHLR